MVFDEIKFKKLAGQQITRCRPGDWNHATRVANWVKRLTQDENSLPLLLTAAYIHDIGWRDVLPKNKKITFEELLEYEPTANINSSIFIKDFLNKLSYSHEDAETVCELVELQQIATNPVMQ